MTQFEKRLLKDGFSPAQVECIMADLAGGTPNLYTLAKRIYALWKKDFRYAVKQKEELAALKRLLRLYDTEEVATLAERAKFGSIVGLESVAAKFAPHVTFDPQFEIEVGWKYNGIADAFAKEAAYASWLENKETLCQKS